MASAKFLRQTPTSLRLLLGAIIAWRYGETGANEGRSVNQYRIERGLAPLGLAAGLPVEYQFCLSIFAIPSQ